MRASISLVVLWSAIHAAGCVSGNTRDAEAGDAADASAVTDGTEHGDAGGPPDSGVDAEAGPDGATGDGGSGAGCNALDPGPATVTTTSHPGPRPAAVGGTIVGGTYRLVAVDRYETSAAAPGARSELLVIEAGAPFSRGDAGTSQQGTIQAAIHHDGRIERYTNRFTTCGTSMAQNGMCGNLTSEPLYCNDGYRHFDATPSSLRIHSWHIVSTYMRESP